MVRSEALNALIVLLEYSKYFFKEILMMVHFHYCFDLGTFKLQIEFTEEYPNKPPTVRFLSRMFHPNGMS